jgi:hypothetical protein
MAERTAGPLVKLVEFLTSTDPARLLTFRREYEAIVADYFEDNTVPGLSAHACDQDLNGPPGTRRRLRVFRVGARRIGLHGLDSTPHIGECFSVFLPISRHV